MTYLTELLVELIVLRFVVDEKQKTEKENTNALPKCSRYGTTTTHPAHFDIPVLSLFCARQSKNRKQDKTGRTKSAFAAHRAIV
jgi:hypothetical protein